MEASCVLKQIESLIRQQKEPFVHRDISWIQFNNRVLTEALDPKNPILERFKFLGITSSNLDEFFIIRFASLKAQIDRLKKTELRVTKKQLAHLQKAHSIILSSVFRSQQRQDRCYRSIRQELKAHKIFVYDYRSKQEELTKMARKAYLKEIAPHLGDPIKLNKASLSKMSNLQTALVIDQTNICLAPKTLPPLTLQKNASGWQVFYSDDLILKFYCEQRGLDERRFLMRLSRDADVAVDIEDEDPASIPDVVKSSIKSREYRRPVRLQIRGTRSGLQNWLAPLLGLQEDQIFYPYSNFGLSGNFKLVHRLQKHKAILRNCFYPALKSFTPPTLKKPGEIFSKLREHDYLLHHPYDSFDGYVNFIKEAADDPKVLSIQQTVYRIDTLSRVTEILKKASQRKKHVRILIETRARFDELNNLELAEDLRKAGVEVFFPKGPLKLHAKVALVIRKDQGQTQLFTHLSTGNYNAQTARLYTDLAILTARREVGEDARLFFESVCRGKIPKGFKHLVLAPTQLHRRLLSLIDNEISAARAGKFARIFIKANALVDRQIVDKLYEASKAGVKVELVIRGACSLIPRVKGLSENIRVISVVDKFLEHSRMYFFLNSNEIYLSSADAMPRNFFSRLELAFPILDHNLSAFLKDHFSRVYLNDRTKARELTKRGIWSKRRKNKELGTNRAQDVFEQMARDYYKHTPLHKRDPY